jgi:type II secretory pathway component GspD/PulD (secretin)
MPDAVLKVTADIAQYNFTANVGLGNATSEQLAELLGFVFKNNSYMKITAVDSQSVIIKYAHKSDIEKIQKIIKMLSVPENNSVTNSSSEPEYESISVMYVDINETALILNKIIAEIYPGKITIQPLTSSRQLLVFGKIPYREIVRKLMEEIEFPLNQLQRKTFQLKFADPEKIKSLIDILFMDRNSSSMDNQRILSKETVITTAYPSLKQIVVQASEDKMKEIEKLIEEWDSPFMFEEMKQSDANEKE